ncbi:TolC family protein [Niabella beijingensis]|uniref:TolC family protein n=1 Tax=Niabella beijingensis TaxID=2872700 RepID=UPI001CBE2D6A|nr:TolC family protein [Niabella beijingensis]MBZ4192632.1 TolC family protein [Niabella beijingensis]
MKYEVIIVLFLTLFSTNGTGQQVKRISLSEALSMASAGNRELQVQVLEAARQKEITREVKSLLLPNVAAGGSYQYYFDRQIIFLPGSFAGTSKPVQEVAVGGKHAFNSMITASQPLVDLVAGKQAEQARYDEQIQREKTGDLEGRLGEQLSIAYLNMLFMQAQIILQEQSLSRNRKALDDTRSLFLQGRSLKADTLRAFIAVENLRSSISYLKNRLNVSGIYLKRLIGLDDSVEMELSDSLAPENEPSGFYELGGMLETAVQKRNDIAIQKLTMVKEQLGLAAARAERLPRVSAVGHYQLQAQADNIRLRRYAWPPTSFLGVQVSVPVFSGYRIRSRISQAEIRIKQERIGLDDLQHSVRAELAALTAEWKETGQQLQLQKRTMELAGISYSVMDDRYRNGRSTRLELSDAELALTQSRINYLQAVYSHRVVQVQLRRAQGLLKLQ